MGTASRSVEILHVPPPKAAANLAGGPTAPGRKRTISGRKLIMIVYCENNHDHLLHPHLCGQKPQKLYFPLRKGP